MESWLVKSFSKHESPIKTTYGGWWRNPAPADFFHPQYLMIFNFFFPVPEFFFQKTYHLLMTNSSPWKITIFKNGKPR